MRGAAGLFGGVLSLLVLTHCRSTRFEPVGEPAAEGGPSDGGGAGVERAPLLPFSVGRSVSVGASAAGPPAVGRPAIAVLPAVLDFGALPRGTTRTLALLVENAGEGGAGVAPLAVTRLGIQGGSGEFRVTGLSTAPLLAGQSFEAAVAFAPGFGLAQATLTVASNDPVTPTVSIPLTGSLRDPLPCQLVATSSELDFGLVAPGQAATLEFALSNVGAGGCQVKDLGLRPTGSPAFSLPGGPTPQVTLEPGDGYDVRVRYAPTAEGEDLGAVIFDASNAASPKGEVPLVGSARKGCLSISPTDLDFGLTGADCPRRGAQVVLGNGCAMDLAVDAASIGGGTSGEFTLAPVALPVSLAPGASMALSLTYAPSPLDPNFDPDGAALSIDDGEGQPRTVGLSGVGLASQSQTDAFTEGLAPKVDVLFVIDNSGSFGVQQQSMQENAQAFLQAALAGGVDFHLGVTTTGLVPATGGWSVCQGGANGGEAGRLFPVDGSSPRILTPQTPNLVSALAENVEVGTCQWDEEPFQAAVDALTPPLSTSAKAPGTPNAADGNLGFLRSDALLEILFFQDDDDESHLPVDHFTRILRELKGPGNEWMITASAVTAVQGCNDPNDLGIRYFQLVSELGGTIQSVCTTDWPWLLQGLAAQAFSPRLRFPLSARPSDPTWIAVAVGGQPVPPTGAGAPTWAYAAATNEVDFDPSAPPPAGASVEVTYPIPCP